MPAPTVIEQAPSQGYRYGNIGQFRTREWTVVASSHDNALELLAAETPPIVRGAVFRDPYGNEYDSLLRLQEFEVSPLFAAPTGGTGLYLVRAFYSFSNARLGVAPTESGLPKFTVETALQSSPVDVDGSGNPLLTAAGEAIDPPLTADLPTEVLRVDYMTSLYPSWLACYGAYSPFLGTINGNTIYGKPAGSFRFEVPQIQEAERPNAANGNPYLRVTLRLSFKPGKVIQGTFYNGWQTTYIHRGKYKKSGTAMIPIRDGEENPVTEPVLLNADGTDRLPLGSPPVIKSAYLYPAALWQPTALFPLG